jgi:malate permease and related proteins
MVETLFQAYSPLIFWVGLGIFSLRILPERVPRLLGRSLYWLGVPWQIFALARYTDLSGGVGQVPLITVSTLLFGIVLAWSVVVVMNRLAQAGEQARLQPEEVAAAVLPKAIAIGGNTSTEKIASAEKPASTPAPAALLNPWQRLRHTLSQWPTYNNPQQGSFILAGMLGNTGFVGLGLMPDLISAPNMRWAVFFSLTQNLIGTYTIGVLVASYFGGVTGKSRWWGLIQNVLLVPSLWAFCLGYFTKSWPAPEWLDAIGQGWYYWVIPASFLLMGMRLGQLDGWQSVQRAAGPVFLKLLILPLFVALGTTLLGLDGEPRLALVMMSGMPCAFAGLILAEEYELDRDLAASSIALSTIGLLFMIPIWLWVF